MSNVEFHKFQEQFEGEFLTDNLHRLLYATDASVYRKIPTAVAYPKNVTDLKKLVAFGAQQGIALTPRAAGTSLAGQCVGDGIIVDISRHFTEIVHFDAVNMTVTVQPGVIRDELNQFLAPEGLFFAPNTSTANRCMIGGMVGNNSCGTTSIRYGTTRDKVLRLKAVLSNGEEVVFESLSKTDFFLKMKQDNLEGEIYRAIYQELSQNDIQKEIQSQFPKPEIHRRNTGYAIDELLKSNIFAEKEDDFNLCALLTGSEGTLAMITEITLQLDPLPPKYRAMIATHYDSIDSCLRDVVIAMEHQLFTCEMMDDVILDCTKNNKTYESYRTFVEAEPKAILLLELRDSTKDGLQKRIEDLLESLQQSGLSYHNAVLFGETIDNAIELRKAGLGLLGNMPGDAKAVACIEDTAVALVDLPDYISQFTKLMKKYNQKVVYYAHAGAGELHLRPILNLKQEKDVAYFRAITTDVAKLVKKFNGSFSGEHGDGIVRSEFIPIMIGERNYALLKRIKSVFDPNAIFNPGKIVDAYAMDESLRYMPNRIEPEVATFMDFGDYQGILRLAENCNGSGDCRKTEKAAGAMCPSYHATRDEKHTTRARANVLREVLTNNQAANKFDSEELKEVLDLCISCKACASECPSNVDISTAKAEFLYQYYQTHKPSLPTRMFAKSTKLYKQAGHFPKLSNFLFSNPATSRIIKKISGVHSARTMPRIPKKSFAQISRNEKRQNGATQKREIYLFVDEFSNYLDVDVAIDAYELLIGLGYSVVPITHLDSSRAMISKGFLKEARIEIDKNIRYLSDKITSKTPLVGIEPSAILSFRDEYLRLATDRESAQRIAKHTFLIEEFLANEMKNGAIQQNQFSTATQRIKIHVHCHQKSLSNQKVTFDILNFPKNFTPTIIPAGCCGMAGSFGYEEEHYDVSMKIGALTLFPAVKKTADNIVIVSSGTSCRHQIKDGTGRKAVHPISVLREALIEKKLFE